MEHFVLQILPFLKLNTSVEELQIKMIESYVWWILKICKRLTGVLRFYNVSRPGYLAGSNPSSLHSWPLNLSWLSLRRRSMEPSPRKDSWDILSSISIRLDHSRPPFHHHKLNHHQKPPHSLLHWCHNHVCLSLFHYFDSKIKYFKRNI